MINLYLGQSTDTYVKSTLVKAEELILLYSSKIKIGKKGIQESVFFDHYQDTKFFKSESVVRKQSELG